MSDIQLPRRTFLSSRTVKILFGFVAAALALAFLLPMQPDSRTLAIAPGATIPAADSPAIASLVEKFAPQVRLHPEERYFPSSVAWYLERTQVHTPARVSMGDLPTLMATKRVDSSASDKTRASIAEKVEDTLEEKLGQSVFAKHFLKIRKDRREHEHAARVGELKSAKTYVHLREPGGDARGLEIQYWFFYPYSGPVLAGPAGGAHEGDWEHITVRLDPSLQRVEKVFFAAHDREGAWVNAEDVQFVEDTHPVVYSARYGHASYPSAGIQSRGMLPADRTGDGGEIWQTWENLKIIADTSGLRDDIPWLGYAGRWGRTGVLFSGPRGPAFQRYWSSEH